jgi:hypothetical protein
MTLQIRLEKHMVHHGSEDIIRSALVSDSQHLDNNVFVINWLLFHPDASLPTGVTHGQGDYYSEINSKNGPGMFSDLTPLCKLKIITLLPPPLIRSLIVTASVV